ncbi:hypothetical protein [Roseateles sp. BYS87W]|uniref:Uncharacterized protein n=1 Tax=Pelomonas baiyunensis TaxID=3299026 RepID=A0ABW7GZH0_9BURK
MTTPEHILSLLGRANAHEAQAGAYYRQAKGCHDDDRSHYFEKERDEADAARELRATAWALVQADPTLQPPGVVVPAPASPTAGR